VASLRKYPAMVTVDKNQYGKQKGVGIKPTPNYYQTSGLELLHNFSVTRSNF
jgi:hypothetical protein